MRLIKTFNDKYPLVGPSFWILSLQYLITQLVAARAWKLPFSLRFNTISDLGNTACGPYGGRLVCSPLHDWMNASFIVLGVSMIIGSSLIYHEFRRIRPSGLGFSFMALAGFGTVLVGLFPENTIGWLHIVGAGLPFLIGNIGMVMLGYRLDLPSKLSWFLAFLGVLGLSGLFLLLSGIYLGLGIGGMERVAAYPQTIWLITFGIYMSSNHFRKT